jgi:hypothetical protein
MATQSMRHGINALAAVKQPVNFGNHDMKTFLDWMLKALTGALAVGIFLAAAGSHVLPLTLPLLTVGGRKLVLNMPDAVGLIVFVCLAAAIFYTFGHGIWKAMSFLRSRF